jgi:flavorubredoxin
MRNIILHEESEHRFVLLNESEPGEENGIPSNQFLVSNGRAGVLLDPGGFGVMPGVLAELYDYLGPEAIAGIVLSHQDPDIVGGLATWLDLTPATVYVSEIWLRFLPHYGLRSMERFVGVPDSGVTIEPAAGLELQLVPAHFLHSCGHFNVFDPRSRILFTGDIGAAMVPEGEGQGPFITDFQAHRPYIEPFHRRYMACNRAARLWAERAAALEPRLIAPQHGPVYSGAAVTDFLEWMRGLECGADLMDVSGHFQTEAPS